MLAFYHLQLQRKLGKKWSQGKNSSLLGKKWSLGKKDTGKKRVRENLSLNQPFRGIIRILFMEGQHESRKPLNSI